MKTTVKVFFILISLFLNGIIFGEKPYYNWYYSNVYRKEHRTANITCFVNYYPDGFIYTDTIDDTPYRRSNVLPNILIADEDEYKPKQLVLRRGMDPENSGTEESNPIFARVLEVDGEKNRLLRGLSISSLAVYHGKLYAGLSAWDHEDKYRRLLFVTESVESGEGLSRIFKSKEELGQCRLIFSGIQPYSPHNEGDEDVVCKTSIRIQIRSSEDYHGIHDATFMGPEDLDYYLLPEGNEKVDFLIDFPEGHKWVQYKVILETQDSRISPVLSSVKLIRGSETIIHDNSWNKGQLFESRGISAKHSPGEIVLENKVLDDKTVSMVKVIQPRVKEPPQWAYNIFDFNRRPGRELIESEYPYTAIGSMKVFQNKLYFLLGPQPGVTSRASMGNLGSYDYAKGIFRIESPYYMEMHDNPMRLFFWSEGGGKFRKMGDILINPQSDTKKGRGRNNIYMRQGPEIYFYTDGSGEWEIGLIPDTIRVYRSRIGTVHVWDMIKYDGRYYISTNAGILYRDIPDEKEDHYDSGAWRYLSEYRGSRIADFLLKQGSFVIFDQNLFFTETILRRAPFNNIVNLFSISNEYNIYRIMDLKEFEEGRFIAMADSLNRSVEYSHRLIVWDGRDKLFFTDQKFHILQQASSLILKEGEHFSHKIQLSCNKKNIKFLCDMDALPDGIFFDKETLTLIGKPSEKGIFEFALKAVDIHSERVLSSIVLSIAVYSEVYDKE